MPTYLSIHQHQPYTSLIFAASFPVSWCFLLLQAAAFAGDLHRELEASEHNQMMMACIGARRGSTALRTRNSSKKGVTWCSSTCSNIFKFEARQVIERMDWSNIEAEEQNILYIYKILQVDIGLFDNWAACKETVSWHGNPRSNWTSKSWSVSSQPWDICKVYLAISWRNRWKGWDKWWQMHVRTMICQHLMGLIMLGLAPIVNFRQWEVLMQFFYEVFAEPGRFVSCSKEIKAFPRGGTSIMR